MTLSILIEEAYNFLEESPHKNNPFLNKNIPRNAEYRKNLAEKLRYLRQARDKARVAGKTYKANIIDNITRSLTNTPTNDPTFQKMIKTPLKDFSKKEKANLFTYKPKFTTVPWEKLDLIKNRIDYEKQSKVPLNFKISNYMSKNDVTDLQKSLKITNDRKVFDDRLFEIFKYYPRMAATIREPNPHIFYNQSPRLTKYYNLKPEEAIRPSSNIYH